MKYRDEALVTLRETLERAIAELGEGWTVNSRPGAPTKDAELYIHHDDPYEDMLVFAHGEHRDDERILRVNRYDPPEGVCTEYTFSHLDHRSLAHALIELTPWLVPDKPLRFGTAAAARNYFRKIVKEMKGWWVDQENDEPGTWWTLEAISPSSEMRISFCAMESGAGNIKVRGVWPKDTNGRECVAVGTDDITIKMSVGKRSSKALANDVMRRLVAAFIIPNTEALLTKIRRDRWITEGNKLWKSLVREAGGYGVPDEEKQRLRLTMINLVDDKTASFRFGDVTITGGTANLNIQGVLPATTLQIVKLLCSSS